MPNRLTNQKLRKLYPLLKVLEKTPDEEKSHIINSLNEDAILALCECVHNALSNQNVANRQKLCRGTKQYSSELRYIAHGRSNPRQKCKKLVQVGGGAIGLILSAVIPLLTNLIMGAIK